MSFQKTQLEFALRRAKKAEAEVERLKAALVEQVKQYPDYSDICRKALEAKP